MLGKFQLFIECVSLYSKNALNWINNEAHLVNSLPKKNMGGSVQTFSLQQTNLTKEFKRSSSVITREYKLFKKCVHTIFCMETFKKNLVLFYYRKIRKIWGKKCLKEKKIAIIMLSLIIWKNLIKIWIFWWNSKGNK